jgi:hypothetical protein
VVAALNQLFEEKGSSFKLEHAFSCELAPEKRKWLHASSVLAEPAYANLVARVEGKQERSLDPEVILKAHVPNNQPGQRPSPKCQKKRMGRHGP